MSETLTAAVPQKPSDPAAGSQPATQAPKEKELKRQIVSFQFFKVMPEWRRLPTEERTAHKQAFAAVVKRWNQPDKMLTLPYSTVGTRSE